MDRIDQLRIFIRVAHCRSFTLAAEQLGLPRPTISLAIQQLENRLGTRLFTRTTRRVSLTLDGEALLNRAMALVADSEELEQQFHSQFKLARGRLRVEFPSRIARRQVAPALPAFLAQHPGIELELSSNDRVIDLVYEGIDCALRVGALSASSLVARPLGNCRLINCASPGYLARHGVPKTPADLPRHLAVNYVSRTGGRSALWEWMDDGCLQTQLMQAKVSTDNTETYIASCLSGLGMIQIPAFDIREHLEAGELVEVLQDWRAPSMPVQLVYPHRGHITPRMQVFSNWLLEVMRPCVDFPVALGLGRVNTNCQE